MHRCSRDRYEEREGGTLKPLPGQRKADRGQATKSNLVETGKITVYLTHGCGIESSKRTGEKDTKAETGNESGMPNQNAKRKAKIKYFFNGK